MDTQCFTEIVDFADAESALARLEKESPRFAMIDLVLPGMGGVDFLEVVVKKSPATRVLVVTDRLEPVLIRHVLAKGAHGCINKGMPVEDLQTAIRHVLAGHTFLCSLTSSRLQHTYLNPSGNLFEMLTKQERRVLQLYARGLSAKQIAGDLGISSGTASNHLTNIKQKLGVVDSVGLLKVAAEHGLIPPLR